MVDRTSILNLAVAGLASAASVPVTVIACISIFFTAIASDGLNFDHWFGLYILIPLVWQGLASIMWLIGGASFVLFPAASLLTRERPWLRSLVLMSLGLIVGVMIAAHVNPHAAVGWLGAVAGLVAGSVFTVVGRDC